MFPSDRPEGRPGNDQYSIKSAFQIPCNSEVLALPSSISISGCLPQQSILFYMIKLANQPVALGSDQTDSV